MGDAPPSAVRYVRHQATLWRGVFGGVLVLPPGAHESWFITSPGDVIWDLLLDPYTVDQLVAALSIRFDELADTVLSDIEPVMKILTDIGALSTC